MVAATSTTSYPSSEDSIESSSNPPEESSSTGEANSTNPETIDKDKANVSEPRLQRRDCKIKRETYCWCLEFPRGGIRGMPDVRIGVLRLRDLLQHGDAVVGVPNHQ